jgi:putative membrane protein
MADDDSPASAGGAGPDGSGGGETEGPGLRNTLANERTLLAWFRTSLALLAASFAVVKLTDIAPRALRLAMGSYLIGLAVGVIAVGYVQWRARQARIRAPEPLERSLSALSLTVALFLLAAFVIAVIVVAP